MPPDWAEFHVARAKLAQFFALPELRNCVDALAPEVDPARMRADLVSQFRLAEAYTAHAPHHPDRQARYAAVAALGEQWLAAPHDGDVAANVRAMKLAAIAMGHQRDFRACRDILETVWSYRDDPAAALAEPGRSFIWIAHCDFNLNVPSGQIKQYMFQCLADVDVSDTEVGWAFHKIADWAALAGDPETVAVYMRDLAEILGAEDSFVREAERRLRALAERRARMAQPEFQALDHG